MRRLVVYILILIIMLMLVIGFLFYKKSSQPMYKIGNVSKGINLSASLEPPLQSSIEYFQVEDDIKLYYFTQGKGRNVLIIHGGPGMPYAESWTGLNSLSHQYRFIYYDQRGSGSSTRPINTFESKNYYKNMMKLESTLGLSAQIADIERIRRILGEDKLIIIGHSFGSVIASLYAAEFPEQVEKLIFVAPAPLLKMPMEVPGLFDSIKKELKGDNLNDYQKFIKEFFNYKDIFKRSESDLVELNNELGKFFNIALKNYNIVPPNNSQSGGWMTQAIYLSMGREFDFTAELAKLKIPTLIIHPGDDFVQSEEASKLYLEVFPHAEYTVLTNAGHMAFNDVPEEFAMIVSNFLNVR